MPIPTLSVLGNDELLLSSPFSPIYFSLHSPLLSSPSYFVFFVAILGFVSIRRRLVQELSKFGIDSQNIVVNQVLMPDASSQV